MIQKTAHPTYKICSIGAGISSFILLDNLRIAGFGTEELITIGPNPKPYHLYKQRCLNSNISLADRLRSDSGSTADNIWGVPSYGVREMQMLFRLGKFKAATKIAWKLFTEPYFSEPFTPKSGQVYNSIDQEALRIGWKEMYTKGMVTNVVRLNPNHFEIKFENSLGEPEVIYAENIHFGIGYSNHNVTKELNFLKTLPQTRAFHVYEDHTEVLEKLKKNGGTVLVRGRGISASRLVEKIFNIAEKLENSQTKPKKTIKILHHMRKKVASAAKHKDKSRILEQNFEYQHYNFPKSSFGGHLKMELEKYDKPTKKTTISTIGGITTANRKRWRELLNEQEEKGNYVQIFGQLQDISWINRKLNLRTKPKSGQKSATFKFDYLIDSTGLVADVKSHKLLGKLLRKYNLELTGFKTFVVSKDFELPGLSNQNSSAYASGVLALGNSYGPVDSFAGINYASQIITSKLAKQYSRKQISGINSLVEFFKWCIYVKPN